jgi:hypothetical protein
MDTFNDSALSAYFHDLVDVCQGEDGQLVYAILKDGELILSPEYITETESFSIPEKKHFQFTVPRASEVMRYFNQEDESIYDDLLLYLKRFSALDDEQWAIVAHYVFLTYLHDHPGIDYCGYLLFYAVPERGKSRTGKSVTNVAFRGIHLIELRPANIFRYSENLHGTLFFDLQDVSKKAERGDCEDIMLLRFEKGPKISRVMYADQGAFNDTVYYDIYGPTIFASNEQLHKILDTRCLPIIMPNRPGNYENPRPELGQELKERLTAWRAKHLTSTFPDLEPIEGISGRLWDITKPMFFVNSLLPVDHQTLEDSILSIAGEKDESRKDTLEGRLVAIIKEITDEGGLDRFVEWSVRISDIRNKFNEGRSVDRHVSPTWIGMKLKSMSLRNRHMHGYSEIRFTSTEYVTLLNHYGLAGRNLLGSTKPLPNKAELNQDVLNLVEPGRDLAQVRGRSSFTSTEERDVYFTRLSELKETGGMTRDDMERLAMEAVVQWRNEHDLPF